MADDKKRCMTELDAATLAEVTRRRTIRDWSESKMLAWLVRAGLEATDDVSNPKAPRLPQPAGD